MTTAKQIALLLLVSLIVGPACTTDEDASETKGVPDGGSDTSDDTTLGEDAPVDTGTSDADPTDASSDVGTDGPCPANIPASGAGCTVAGLACEYGDDPRLGCRTMAVCDGGTFSVTPGGCMDLPSVTCPDTRDMAQGADCDASGAVCAYDGLACLCTDCPPGSPSCQPGPTLWACEAPNPDSECPSARPHAGTTCAVESKTCTYGCDTGTQRVCTDGVWVAASPPGGCPRSTRRVKRDIRYLDEAEVGSLADAVDSTRLATYEYTDPALAGRTRLGFLIEDQPASFAVDPERSQVDLYGYTSMLVAAMQAQSRRIDVLERDLRRLRQKDSAAVHPATHETRPAPVVCE